jgi:hypothetical protein
MLPYTFDALLPTAAKGPIVILMAHIRCHVIVIQAGAISARDAFHVPLSKVNLDQLQKLSMLIKENHLKLRHCVRKAGVSRPPRDKGYAQLQSICKTIVQPVIQTLGLEKRQPGGLAP